MHRCDESVYSPRAIFPVSQSRPDNMVSPSEYGVRVARTSSDLGYFTGCTVEYLYVTCGRRTNDQEVRGTLPKVGTYLANLPFMLQLELGFQGTVRRSSTLL